MASEIRRALLSVSDKTGIVEFARALRELGVEILSTGGTARALREANIELTDVGEFTGFPEMLDGRVKTLHPRVHAGILHRRDLEEHRRTMDEHGLVRIDLVVVNLYPFEATVARGGVSLDEAIEEIDIGGPTLLRSAAKNHADVCVVCSPDDYAPVIAEMRRSGGATSIELRRRLALDVFRRTAAYDRAISAWLGGQKEFEPAETSDDVLPERLEISLPRARKLRYGENPHQKAAVYGSILDRFEQLHGKEISYNNILDLVGALDVTASIASQGAFAVSIIKHSNPCGAAVAEDGATAWARALASDPTSASGGIIAMSRSVDRQTAEAIGDHFVEVLVAPDFAPDAFELLSRKKNRVLLRLSTPIERWGLEAGDLVLRSVPGGMVAMEPDTAVLDVEKELRTVTRRAPSDSEMRALRFGWEIVRHVKSNAIVFTGPDRILGVGAGQMSRVDSVRIAATKASQAGLDLAGSAVASDAFFPFPDGVEVLAEAGARAVIQPGGSVRDAEVIARADELGLAMVFTGRRHFRH